MNAPVTLLYLALCAPSLFTPMLTAQTEILVNTSQDSTQRDPQIERDGAGNMVVVWTAEDYAGVKSHGDIVLRKLRPDGTPDGPEMLVNTITTGDQERPAASMNAAGDLVVAWASFVNNDSSYDIKARRFKNGVPLGDEFLVNTTRVKTQTNPDVAVDSAGNVVVVWDSWTDLSDREVMGRLFGSDGTPLTGEFMVNTTIAYSQAKPAVTKRRDGSFVVVWESWKQDSSTPAGYGMYARLFGRNGAPLTGEIPVNTYTADYQWYGDVESFDDNSFAVVWCSWEQDGSDGSIMLQRFAPNGTKVGGEMPVNATTANYQWLPRIRKFADGGFAVVWSSWKQDGSREGVYAQLFDAGGRKTSFETQVNVTTESFQWEPDVVTSGPDTLTVVWSSWGQTGKDYDVVARRIAPALPQGFVDPQTLGHSFGRTTSRITVHVLDSLALTGNSYEVFFDSLSGKRALLNARNVTTGDTLVRGYAIDRGENIFYLSPRFQGVAIEVVPEFDLDIDFVRSYMVNRSGTNISFLVNTPTAGAKLLAPIDIALFWGSTDTLSDGSYAAPLDTALGTNGKREVVVPFRAWNLTDNQKMDLLIVETVVNKRWSPAEKIVFLTPPAYRSAANNTCAELRPAVPGGALVMPGAGDTNYIFTIKPIRQGEKFTFTTNRATVLDAPVPALKPGAYALAQNFPNPFNPSTTIRYTVARAERVALRVYNILGQLVATLADGMHDAGNYRVRFDGRFLASGVYFYRLEWGGRFLTQRMMLVK
jgi:hypothetical protein